MNSHGKPTTQVISNSSKDTEDRQYPYRASTALPSFLFASVLTTCSPLANADSWVSLGGAPSSSGGGASVSAANKTSDKFGWGLGIVFNGEIAGNDVLDYPAPHNDYTNLSTQRTGNSIGMDALWFPTSEAAFRPYVGLGLYYGKRAEIVQSNVADWYYTQQDKSTLQPGGELGIQHKTSKGRLWGMGYHRVRGVFVSMGW